MILKYNPIMEESNEYIRDKIVSEFPVLRDCSHKQYLSIWNYINNSPEKFYLKKAKDDILELFEDIMTNDKEKIVFLFKEFLDEITLSFKILGEINSLDINEMELPSDDIDLMRFNEYKIHSNYLKLIEGVYGNLILPMSFHFRLERNKSTQGLDLYNIAEEIKRVLKYKYISNYFNNVIRNSIAHGNVKYKQTEVIYEDKDSREEIYSRDVVKMFDELLDLCNGLSLGYRLFCMSNFHFFHDRDIGIPIPIMIDELKSETRGPGWEIEDYLVSETIKNQKQLNIYTKNKFFQTFKVHFYTFRSAIIAESFVPIFDRYFFGLDSKYSLSGWAAFDGKILKKLRTTKSEDFNEYSKALEDSLIFFIPKIKLPKIFFRISNIFQIVKVKLKMENDKFKDKYHPLKIEAKKTEIHRNGFYSVINGSVIVKSSIEETIDVMVRKYCYDIVRKTKKTTKKKANTLNISKYLRIGFMRINIYSTEFRYRHLGNSGLVPELLCTIEFKSLKRIEAPDILGGTPEQKGKYRIVWNKNADIK